MIFVVDLQSATHEPESTFEHTPQDTHQETSHGICIPESLKSIVCNNMSYTNTQPFYVLASATVCSHEAVGITTDRSSMWKM